MEARIGVSGRGRLAGNAVRQAGLTGRALLRVAPARRNKSAAVPATTAPPQAPLAEKASNGAPVASWDAGCEQFKKSWDVSAPSLSVLLPGFKKLQNGSDIRGIAIDAVPGEHVTLTPANAYFIGRAFALWLHKRDPTTQNKAIAIGRDPRISGPVMLVALTAGIASTGTDVHDFDIATTPAMFYATLPEVSGQYGGSIMITASHMPLQNNGFKFFTVSGGLDKPDITQLLELATSECMAAGVRPGTWLSDHGWVMQQALRTGLDKFRKMDFMSKYAEILREVIKQGIKDKSNYNFPLIGFNIVVDAGNGSGGFYAKQVLAPLGADVSGSQFLEPNGLFPNHIPNPENKAAMDATVEAVKLAGADLGIVFDTDVDRAAIVDARARPINSNRFIALMSAITLANHPGTTIVTDSVTSNGLTDFISGLGGKHFRFKRGYKNVIGKGIELNRAGQPCHLMMETSGHGAVKENHFLDDGAYLATLAVVELVRQRRAGGELSAFLDQLPEPVESREFRVKIAVPDFKPVGKEVLAQFHEWVTGASRPASWSLEEVNHEGWRVNVAQGDGKRGWLLLRQSLHDPLLVLNAESDVEGGVAVFTAAVLEFLQKGGWPLDLSNLTK